MSVTDTTHQTTKETELDNCTECSVNPQCPVISSIDNKIIFIDYDTRLHCDKAMSYGFSFICKCKGRLKYYQAFRL